jgi:formate hydrogenlyase transcriptional activator
MNALREYEWPGNIRELQNVIERSVILSSGPSLNVPVAELHPHATPIPCREAIPAKSARRTPVRSILAEVDRNQIIRALEDAGGRVGGAGGAAALLGLKRTTFITRMNKLGISPRSMSEPKMDSSDTTDSADISILQDLPHDLTPSE